ncbi:hypothetical protein [Paracidovorax wautersii]|uniref:Uncharacterized protein n=1 Tax=Paracidovorax wautersii TaxID=1177982 RepID=A0ABU1IHA0_9BURK|nr:hypothetical protein [Paracidovorax wautersii]MDR6216197.1 hypothetical protein [Paracidovorax wautersii]
MLNDHDLDWLIKQLIGTSELLGQQVSPTAAAMLADDLSCYPRDVLSQALSRVRTEHIGRLTPKSIIDRIDEAMGRPGANEAWAMALNALDERKTVVWTVEMSEAWGVARDVAAEGDLVGARMAFIGAYERLVRTAREERRLPEVSVSIGWDGEQRAVAIEKAVQLGYLSQDKAAEHLPALGFTPGFQPIALLTGDVQAAIDAPPEVRARLKKLRDELAAAPERRRLSREQEQRAAEEDLQRRKAETQRRVDAAIANGAAA